MWSSSDEIHSIIHIRLHHFSGCHYSSVAILRLWFLFFKQILDGVVDGALHPPGWSLSHCVLLGLHTEGGECEAPGRWGLPKCKFRFWVALDWIDISLHKVRAFPSSLSLCNSAHLVLEEFQWVADIASFTLINFYLYWSLTRSTIGLLWMGEI